MELRQNAMDVSGQAERIGTIRLGEYGYGLQEIGPLAKTIEEHGYAIAPVGMGGDGGPAAEVLTIIQIGAGLGLGEFLRRFFGLRTIRFSYARGGRDRSSSHPGG